MEQIMEDKKISGSNPLVTFYLIVNQVTMKPELVAHFTSFKDTEEIKDFVKYFEDEDFVANTPTIH
tara:strand:+ start:198 stop:395 length:198 start_codon:yes stop_codon:yes gene_type:complete